MKEFLGRYGLLTVLFGLSLVAAATAKIAYEIRYRDGEIAYLNGKIRMLQELNHHYLTGLLDGANSGGYTIYIGDRNSVNVQCEAIDGWSDGRYYSRGKFKK